MPWLFCPLFSPLSFCFSNYFSFLFPFFSWLKESPDIPYQSSIYKRCDEGLYQMLALNAELPGRHRQSRLICLEDSGQLSSPEWPFSLCATAALCWLLGGVARPIPFGAYGQSGVFLPDAWNFMEANFMSTRENSTWGLLSIPTSIVCGDSCGDTRVGERPPPQSRTLVLMLLLCVGVRLTIYFISYTNSGSFSLAKWFSTFPKLVSLNRSILCKGIVWSITYHLTKWHWTPPSCKYWYHKIRIQLCGWLGHQWFGADTTYRHGFMGGFKKT